MASSNISEPISLDTYDRLSVEKLAEFSMVEQRAVDTVCFQRASFPYQAMSFQEISKFSDFVFNANTFLPFVAGRHIVENGLFTSFSKYEAELIRSVHQMVDDLLEKNFDQKAGPYLNILSNFGLFRALGHIRAAFGEDISIFEAGPGCGYLGLLSGQLNCRYTSFDVAQGLYLWQSILGARTDGEDFCEWAHQDFTHFTKVYATDGRRNHHLPWWFYLKLWQEPCVTADVIVSNNNLAEMHPDGARYLIKLSKTMLSASRCPLFIFAGFGSQSVGNAHQVMTTFKEFGFELLCHRNMYVLSPMPEKLPNAVREVITGFESGVMPLSGEDHEQFMSLSAVLNLPEDLPTLTEVLGTRGANFLRYLDQLQPDPNSHLLDADRHEQIPEAALRNIFGSEFTEYEDERNKEHLLSPSPSDVATISRMYETKLEALELSLERQQSAYAALLRQHLTEAGIIKD